MTNTSTRRPAAGSIRPARTLLVTSFQSGVDISVIALWLGHQSTASTDVYLHADMTIKQNAIDRTRPAEVTPGTYTPDPAILAWLDTL